MRIWKRFASTLCALLVLPVTAALADDYSEGVSGDLGVVAPFTAVNMTAGSNTISGTWPGTPPSDTDIFTVVVGPGETITNVAFTTNASAGGGEVYNFTFDTAGGGTPNSFSAGNVNTAVSFGPGTYQVDLNGSVIFSTKTWSVVLTVTGGPPPPTDKDMDGLTDAQELAGQDQNGVVHGFGPTDECEADSDGDGIDDIDELDGEDASGTSHGFGRTNPNLADTDGDTIDDDKEIAGQDNGGTSHGYGSTNPNDADSDGDTIDDDKEIAGQDNSGASHGFGPTNPNDADTDGDNLFDDAEIAGEDNSGGSTGFGPTDPNNPDSDGDTIDDDKEIVGENNAGVNHGYGPTNPNEKDTDSGGVDDNVELDLDCTNPNDGLDDLVFGPPPAPVDQGWLRVSRARVPTGPGALVVSADLDTGDASIDFANDTCTFEFGGDVKVLNGMSRVRNGVFRWRSADRKRTIMVRTSRWRSGKARITLYIRDWDGNLGPAGAPGQLHLAVRCPPSIDAEAEILPSGETYDSRVDAAAEPQLALTVVNGNLTETGRDRLQMRIEFAGDGTVPATQPDLVIRFGKPGALIETFLTKRDYIITPLPGQGWRFRHRDPRGSGIVYCTADFANRMITLVARNIDLQIPRSGKGPEPFYVSLGLDGKPGPEHAVQFTAIHLTRRLYHK